MYFIITKSRCWELFSQPPRLASLDDDSKKTKITMKLLWGFKKNTTLTIMHKNIFKKIPGGRLNLFCLRQVVDD